MRILKHRMEKIECKKFHLIVKKLIWVFYFFLLLFTKCNVFNVTNKYRLQNSTRKENVG